jgi:cytochrome c peroxidase
MLKSLYVVLISAFVGASAMAASLPTPASDDDFYSNGQPAEAKVQLGNLLFFDKILSGNKNISCGTCHSPYMGGSDGLSLGVGEGGKFLGPMRTLGEGIDAIGNRVARNAPGLWNLGAKEFTKLNWQGIHQVDEATGEFLLPSGPATPQGLENVLAAQVIFPVVNQTEMLGQPGDNEVIDASIGFPRGTPFLFPPQWDALADRVKAINDYVDLFIAAFDDVNRAEDITFVHIANAIAAFETVAFRATESPFDRFIAGDRQALTVAQRRGMDIFYDRGNGAKAGCHQCHSGTFQTDHDFYSIAIPQFGPGVLPGPAGQDYGLEEVTRDDSDRYKFRTPSLRNVALTAPYGHNGAYNTLEEIVRHHLDPLSALENWEPERVIMRDSGLMDNDFTGWEDTILRQELADTNELSPTTLSETDIANLVAFLESLTDPASLNMRGMIPQTVPSGLPVGD